jgi:hypothetical protein
MKQSFLLPLAFLCFQSLAMGAARGVLESGYIHERRIVDSGALVSRSTTTNQYTQEGRLLGSETWYDDDGDGITNEIETIAWTYDNAGHLLSSLEEIDFGPDGTIDWRRVTTFTNLSSDQTVQFSLVDWDGDGIFDYTVTRTTTFDKQKNPILQEFAIDGTNYATVMFTWTFEKDQTVIYSETDSDGDGIPNSIANSTLQLNHRGQPISGETQRITDTHTGAGFTITSNYAYDKSGNLLQTTYDYFLTNADGSPLHFRDTITGSYLPRSQIVSKPRAKKIQVPLFERPLF